MEGELRPILFRCDGGEGHLVSRGQAERRNGDLVCPRHHTSDTQQQTLATDGGVSQNTDISHGGVDNGA